MRLETIRADAEEPTRVLNGHLRSEWLCHECTPVWVRDLPTRAPQAV